MASGPACPAPAIALTYPMWVEISLRCDAAASEALETRLWAHGAASVSLYDAGDQPLLEPAPGETPLWGRVKLVALFDAGADVEDIGLRLLASVDAATAASLSVRPLADRDWVRAWMDTFRPMRFGDRLWVCPGHCPVPEPDAVNVLLDPGLAFGTGTHPTTGLCLRWLDGHALAGKRVIDFGCGSGILAIAALRLGAAEAWAVDIDEQALLASRENARRNGVAGSMRVGDPTRLPAGGADVLVANILANPLVGLAPRFAEAVSAGGHVVLSGILAAQADAVSEAYAPWFDMAAPAYRDGWALLAGVRNVRS